MATQAIACLVVASTRPSMASPSLSRPLCSCDSHGLSRASGRHQVAIWSHRDPLGAAGAAVRAASHAPLGLWLYVRVRVRVRIDCGCLVCVVLASISLPGAVAYRFCEEWVRCSGSFFLRALIKLRSHVIQSRLFIQRRPLRCQPTQPWRARRPERTLRVTVSTLLTRYSMSVRRSGGYLSTIWYYPRYVMAKTRSARRNMDAIPI